MLKISLYMLSFVLFCACGKSTNSVIDNGAGSLIQEDTTTIASSTISSKDTTTKGNSNTDSQESMLAATPPMGFMTWNFFGPDITAEKLKNVVDGMVSSGLVDAGYDYLVIDDGWNSGRDEDGNILPDPKKFPNGMKEFVDYAHNKGVKVGIYSDAAKNTCGGYTGSYGHENQDAETFASWGIDYLKYDYCHAPADRATAETRYQAMADALEATGRDILFAACEWGYRSPWLWASQAGAQIWRTTDDIRDAWIRKPNQPAIARGIMDIVDVNGGLSEYAGPGHWNDPDMLVIGLYGTGKSSSDLVGKDGCTDVEYQSQMSLWCLMAAPLLVSCDVRNMNQATKDILMNKDIIAINQDPLGKQAKRVLKTADWSIFVKPLSGGDYAVGVLNKSEQTKDFHLRLKDIGMNGNYHSLNVWTGTSKNQLSEINTSIASHETKVWRLSKN